MPDLADLYSGCAARFIGTSAGENPTATAQALREFFRG
jgi:hypothetical protein